MRNFVALIHKDAESDFGVSFPDLPGVVTAGVSLDDARKMAADALALHLEGMAEEGQPVPEPSSLDAIMADAVNREAVAIVIPAPAASPARVVRVNITLAEDLLREIDRHAEMHGFTRSGFLASAAKRVFADGASSVPVRSASDRSPR
jgi:predicted RNase H-like HicB family nuclease